MDELVLYGCWRSSTSHRLQIGLRLKELTFQYVPVDLDQQEQNSTWYQAINPWGEVPSLVVNGKAWCQSLSILLQLDERYPSRGQALLPADSGRRRQCLELAELINSSLQPLLLPGRLRRPILEAGTSEGGQPLEPALNQGIRTYQQQALAQLNQRLMASPGPFCLGDQPCLADVLVIPQLEAAMRLGLDLNPFRRLSDLHCSCLRLEAFASAAPEQQPDAPRSTIHSGHPAAEPRRQQVLAHKEPGPALADYLSSVANAPIPGLELCRRQTLENFGVVASKMTALDGCLLLRWLCRTRAVRQVLEIGVFTGSSSLAILDGLPADGSLVAIDSEPRFTALAEHCWRQIGKREQVHLLIGDASDTLTKLRPGFDLIYVDADNHQYESYLELALPLLSPRGLMVFDNVLWRGRVVTPGNDASAIALDRLNRSLQQRSDLRSTVLTLSDGMALVELVQSPTIEDR